MRTLVIVPAYNEEAALPGTLAELHATRPDLDVVVVSDGSTDATAALARCAGVEVLELPFNLGIGGALRTGFLFAVREDYDAAVQFDADGQHDPKCIADLLVGIERGAQMVVGSRFAEASAHYQVSGARRSAMGLLRVAVRLIAGGTFTDTSSGFRAFDREVLEFFARNYPSEYMESVESLILATLEGFDVVEVPTKMRERTAGLPSARRLRLAYHYLRLLLVLGATFRRAAVHVGRGPSMTGRAHFLLVLVTITAIGFVIQLLRSGRLRARFAMLWASVGVFLVVLTAFPGLLDWTAERLGIFYPPAVFLLAATAFLFIVCVQFSWEISRLEERTRVLAEEVALLRRARGGAGDGEVDRPRAR